MEASDARAESATLFAKGREEVAKRELSDQARTLVVIPSLISLSDPSGTRTRVAGVRGRCPNR